MGLKSAGVGDVQADRDIGLHCHALYTNSEELHRVGTGIGQFALRRGDVQTVRDVRVHCLMHCHVPYTNSEELHRVGAGLG